jgi:hypothetical protein
MSTWTTPARQASQAAGGGTNPYTFTYGSAVLAGSLLIATITWASGSGTISSWIDSVNSAQWTLGKLFQGQSRTVATYYFNNSAAGTPTITITLNAAQATQFITALEFVGPSAVLGATPVTNAAVATTTPTTTNITPITTTSLIYGVVRGGTVSAGAGGSWVLVATGSGQGVEYIQPASVTPLAATFTTTSVAYAAEILEFVPAVDGGTSDAIEKSSASITGQVATDGGTSDAVEKSSASVTTQVAIDGGSSNAIEKSSASITVQDTVDGGISNSVEKSSGSLTAQVAIDGGSSNSFEKSSASITARVAIDGGISDAIEKSSASITAQVATDGGSSNSIEKSSASITSQIATDGGTTDAIEKSSASIAIQSSNDGGTSMAIEKSSASIVVDFAIDGGSSPAIEKSSATLTLALALEGGTTRAIEGSSASMNLLVPAFQLYPSFPSSAPALSGVGIRNYSKGLFQLITGNQSSNFPAQPGLSDPWYSGYSFRELWLNVEPTPADFTNPNWQSLLNWTNLDNCVNAALAVGKYCAISIFAGHNSPSWLAAPPFSCQQFLINSISTFTTWDPTVNYLAGQVVFYSVDGRYYNALDVSFDIVPGTDEAIWDRIGTPQLVNAPWDPTFIDRWTHVIQAFGARYDGNPAVAYVVISGPGTSDAEGFVAKNLNDLAELNSAPFTGIGPWVGAVSTFYQAFIDAFPNTPVVFVTGSPYPYSTGQPPGSQPTSLYLGVPRTAFEIETIVTTQAVGNFGKRWGLRSSGLRANYNLNSFGSLAIKQYGRLGSQLPCGFQMLKKSFDEPSTDTALNVAYNTLGGTAMEIYLEEMYQPMSQNWAQLILAGIYSPGDIVFTPQIRQLQGTLSGIGDATASSMQGGGVILMGGEFTGSGEITMSSLRHLRVWVVLGVTCIVDPNYDPTEYYNSPDYPPRESGPQPVPPGCGYGLPTILFPELVKTWPFAPPLLVDKDSDGD